MGIENIALVGRSGRSGIGIHAPNLGHPRADIHYRGVFSRFSVRVDDVSLIFTEISHCGKFWGGDHEWYVSVCSDTAMLVIIIRQGNFLCRPIRLCGGADCF